LINGIEYKKLCADSLCNNYLYGVRSDNHKIYIAYDIDNDGIDEEYLAYDFNSNVGDTLHGVITTYNNYFFITTTFYVAEICSIPINSILHKSITVHDIENAPSIPINFIEGVGTKSGPGILANYSFLSGAMSLFCFSQKDSTISNIYDMQTCSPVYPLYMNSGDSCTTIMNGTVDYVKETINLTIYPNPASSIISIESTKYQLESIRIEDVLGQEIYYLQPQNNKTEIDISHLPSGIYIIQLQSKNGVVSKKFVKE
jgi:hypothetical protein